MWRRRPCGECAALLLAALLLGCAPPASRPASLAQTAQLPAFGTVPVQQAKALRSDLLADEDRIHALEAQLADRDRQIAAVQGQLDAARGGAASAAGGAATAAQPLPAAAGAPALAAPAAPEPSAQSAASGPPPAPASAVTPGPGGGSPGADQRLAETQKRVAKLQQQLTLEVKRRQDVEAEMSRLLQETSAGPFEHADNVVEKHLREELDRAHKEVGDLRATLLTERRDRGELERRFAALQAQVRTASPPPAGTGSSEEIEALKERQRRVLASIEQDLEASKQREVELRTTIETSNGPDGVSLADAVATLRSQNSALQARLDDEHQHNRDLSAKLQVATRVTDLIFKMRTAGVQPAAAPAAAN